MDRFKLTFVFICAISSCLCQIDIQKKVKLVNGFVEFYNRLPNELFTCDEGYLLNAQQTDISNAYDIEISLKVSESRDLDTTKYVKCTATVAELDVGVAVMKHHCQDDLNPADNPANNEEDDVEAVTEPYVVTEAEFVRRPVQLDNEVQTNTAVTSGEQFIAIPREEPKVHCIGCSSHVNTQAQGVSELADIGVRQLNSLEPNVHHTLASVVDVERQVQVVNGVRYILTLIIDYNTCPNQETEHCLTPISSKACKVTILEKPWVILPSGFKYRAIISNNCTEEWRFGDDGVLPPSDNKENNNISPINPDGETDIKVVHNVDVQSQQKPEKTLTDQDIKNLEEQIVPNNLITTESTVARPASLQNSDTSKEHVVKIEPDTQYSPNSIQTSKPQKVENLDDDKKKTIDELLNYFDFSGFDTDRNIDQKGTRAKRSFKNDLESINIAQRFQNVKKSIENAKHIYTLAQSVVDYLNDIDLEVKSRVLKDVTNAEKESEKGKGSFYYIQFHTITTCKKRFCKGKDTETKICNAVVDNFEKVPQILTAFCHDEETNNHLGELHSVPRDDPLLLKLVQDSIKKIESESKTNRAIRVKKIIDANTQIVSGTVTKVTIFVDQTDCDKSLPLKLRTNCSIIEEYGSQVCDITIHERHWLKEKSISYFCTERPIDIIFSAAGKHTASKSPNDPVVLDMIQEAMRNLEMQTKGNNKQIVIKVNFVSTQLVAGFLTHIEFIVGTTTCPKNVNIDETFACKLLETEPLKTCTAKVWDRSWSENGRQLEVSCKDSYIESNITKKTTTISPTKNNSNSYLKNSINREAQMFVGGKTEQDRNDPKYKKLAEESLAKYLQDTGNSDLHNVISVEKVNTQVVSGTLTTIDFKMSPVAKTSSDVIDCHSKVWEKPWENFKEITEVSCKINNAKVRNKRQLPGGESQRDSNDPKYKRLAQESLAKYLKDTGNSDPHNVVSVEKVISQTVAGILTTIYFKISPATQSSGDVIDCHSKVWERPWENFKEITEVSCKIDNSKVRNKRELVGGERERDRNDPEYKQLAQESLAKYLQDTGNSDPHNVVSVEKVISQTVAGILTTIYFKISPATQSSGDVIDCHSKVWERPWENFKEITEVSCKIDNSKVRNKRELVGGERERDRNDPEYKQLAQESLAKYLQDTGNSEPHKVVSIEKVTTQVVAGTLTKIYFKMSPAAQTVGDTIDCYSKVWEKPWQNFKEVNVTCQIDDGRLKTKRSKRYITGGFVEQDPKNAQYRELAEISLQKYLQEAGISMPHRVVDVKKAFTQAVSGLRTVIDFKIAPVSSSSDNVISCKSDIWQQPWRHTTYITVNCQLDNYISRNDSKLNDEKRIKRSSELKKNSIKSRASGGIQHEDPTTEEYKQLARDALQKYQEKHQDSINHVLFEVNKVEKQVVSGIKYTIDFSAAHKSCAHDVSVCSKKKPLLICHASILRQPWLLVNDIDVTCRGNRKRGKRAIDLKDAAKNDKLQQLTEFEIVDLDDRGKRQAVPDDDYLDEGIRYYYADRAIQQLNDQKRSNNLYKLISIHSVQSSMHMDNTPMVRIYLEAAETYCLRNNHDQLKLDECEELDANNHRLCLARVWPSSDDDKVIQQVAIVCDDDDKFESITGINIPALLKASIKILEKSSDIKYKLVHQGEPQLIPSLDSRTPNKLHFIIRTTNCSKYLDNFNAYNCFVDATKPSKACSSYIWLVSNTRSMSKIQVSCAQTEFRSRRSIPLGSRNATLDDIEIQKMVKEAVEKLEMTSLERYKQKVVKINSYSTKVTSGRITTIDFDVAFSSCLKYEWVDDLSSCKLLEHLPRRHCIAEVWERLWLENGRKIEVSCQDEVVPLEAHVEFQSAATAMALANRALKHIEAKYPHPRKLKVLRIYSMDKQVVAGIHYRMKMEVGLTNCSALSSDNEYCVFDKHAGGTNKFCRVNVWLRPWTEHPPNFRVTCDYQDGAMADIYHQVQSEYLFREFVATYNPDYVNDYEEFQRRFEIFKANVLNMHELNTHERGTATYGVTRFADLTYEEFTKKHLGLKPSLRNENQVPMRKAQIPNVDVPEKFDWRDHGAVTEVKNQGSCGSCWAFSVTGNIEGQWQIKSGKLVSLSEQELVDCDKMDDGCNGGLPDNAYRAIEQLGGLELESDYPYEGEDDKCAFNKTMARVQISSAVNITTNETGMAKWLVQNGPISIGINANAMQFYMGGVSHPWKMLCNPKNLDHGVLIVGYGIKDYPLFHKRLPYWIVKNSWGPSWGEKGYYRVFRGDGTCGVNQMASSAVV